jgi:hypothetical protein
MSLFVTLPLPEAPDRPCFFSPFPTRLPLASNTLSEHRRKTLTVSGEYFASTIFSSPVADLPISIPKL